MSHFSVARQRSERFPRNIGRPPSNRTRKCYTRNRLDTPMGFFWDLKNSASASHDASSRTARPHSDPPALGADSSPVANTLWGSHGCFPRRSPPEDPSHLSSAINVSTVPCGRPLCPVSSTGRLEVALLPCGRSRSNHFDLDRATSVPITTFVGFLGGRLGVQRRFRRWLGLAAVVLRYR